MVQFRFPTYGPPSRIVAMSKTDEAVEVPVDRAEKKIKKIRGGHKATLKKLYSEIDDCIERFSVEMKPILLALKDSLERKAQVIMKLDDEILDKIEEDEAIHEEIEECDNVQRRIREKIIQIDLFFKKLSEIKRDSVEEKKVKPVETVTSQMKLPKLNIEKFDGNPREFMAFMDAFRVAIDENSRLSGVEKLTYLRSYLTGEAEGSIKGIAAIEANYKEALAILIERYGNKQVIVNSHMDALIKLPKVTKSGDTKGIRKLYDEIESNIRSLKSLGVSHDSFGCLLVPILLDKLPAAMNLHLSRKFDRLTDVWEVDKILKELKRELEARERCQLVNEKVNEKNGSIMTKREPTTTDALFAGGNYVISCAYCDGKHYSDRCKVVTDVKKRVELLKEKRRCFLCTRANHMKKDCDTKRKCFRCKGNHHTSICQKNFNFEDAKQERKESIPETKCETAFSRKKSILLQTAQLDVQAVPRSGGLKRSISCKVILDSGSQRSYITKKAAEEIGAVILHKEKMMIGGFGGTTTKAKLHNVVEVLLSKKNYDFNLKLRGIVVDRICSPIQGSYVDYCAKTFPQLDGLSLADEDSKGNTQEVQVLIGLDHYHDIVTGELIKTENGPVAVGSKFGYILSGSIGHIHTTSNRSLNTRVLRIENITNEDIYSAVKKFWEIESIGVIDRPTEEVFDVKVEKRTDRYYVNLPWKKDHPMLCDNYDMSYRRLMNNLYRLQKNPDLLADYSDVMSSQEKMGVIEEVSQDEKTVVGKVYYMPHHAVIREDKSTKIRIVYDASSKSDGASLNECLHSGIPTFTDLLSTLLRFRCYRIGVIADIQQAFLSVGVREEDRNVLRFLWVKDASSLNPELRHMRFSRVCFGIISSMTHLDVTIRHHLKLYDSTKYAETAKRIKNSLYVDDLSTGHDSREEAWKLYKEAKDIFSEAAMNLRKWNTNDEVLAEKIKMSENPDKEDSAAIDGETYASETLNPDERAEVKVLGIPWDKDNDTLRFMLKSLQKYRFERITKRLMLKAIASIFDPLGFLAPVVITLKILFQDVCKVSKDWDAYLDPVHQNRWDVFHKDIDESLGLQIPRYFGTGPLSSAILVGFSDASENAYSSCVYIRSKTEQGVTSSLVVSKTRVAPLKTQSIPRLELLGALILSRLMKRTAEELQKVIQLDRVICCTDAEIVLCWIKGKDKQYKQFVQNRVVEIRKNVEMCSWYHVPGIENIADLPSRGCSLKWFNDHDSKNRWLFGPPWLKGEIADWPIKKDTKNNKFEESEVLGELRQSKKTQCLVDPKVSNQGIQTVIELDKFSSLSKLIRVTAWCRRFIHNCRSVFEDRKKCELDLEEYEEAEALWIKDIQSEMILDQGYNKRKESLGIFEDKEGYFRCRGRIGKAKIEFGARFPMLLPSNSHFSELVIMNAHDKVYHNGIKETLAELRSTYWIVRGRQIVKKIIRKCCLCKILEGMSYPAPVTCDLPEFRVNVGRAFETAAVDFCGPVYVKQMFQKVTKMNKAYIAITTCASTRMIHLELTPDLTTSAYLRSQRRFIARRGFPRLIVSDNGKTFKGSELIDYNTRHKIRWRFNLAKAPWWGGLFERLIRSTKRCLKKVMKNRKLTYEELLTVLTEIEAVINNRPLTYIDEEDFDQILTPSHLFCGRRTLENATESSVSIDLDRPDMVRRNKLINAIIGHFWKRWRNEYLIELRETHKMKTKQKMLQINEGDVVLVQDEGVKRNKWKLGKIEEVIVGDDGIARGATIRTSSKGSIGRVRRPLQKLYPLELSCCSQEKKKLDSSVDEMKSDDKDDELKHCNDPDEEKVTEEMTDQDGDDNYIKNDEECSSSLGPPGGALGGVIDIKGNKKLEKLLSDTTQMKSKRRAAIDGQLCRRIKEIQGN